MSATKKPVTDTATEVAEAEVKKEGISFDYADKTFDLPNPKRWPLGAVKAQEAGKMLGFVEVLLGPKQYVVFEEVVPTLEELEEFLEALFDAAKVDPKD